MSGNKDKALAKVSGEAGAMLTDINTPRRHRNKERMEYISKQFEMYNTRKEKKPSRQSRYAKKVAMMFDMYNKKKPQR